MCSVVSHARVWCVMVCSISGMSGMMYTVCGIVLCDVVTVVVVSLYCMCI